MEDTVDTAAGIPACPRCRQGYHGRPAASRADGKEQEQILAAIHRYYSRRQ